MAVRSDVLIYPTAVPVSPATVSYVVPAGRTTIVRALFLTWTGSIGSVEFRLSIAPASGGGGTEFFRQVLTSAGHIVVRDIILGPLDTLFVTLAAAPATGSARVAAFGSVLQGVNE